MSRTFGNHRALGTLCLPCAPRDSTVCHVASYPQDATLTSPTDIRGQPLSIVAEKVPLSLDPMHPQSEPEYARRFLGQFEERFPGEGGRKGVLTIDTACRSWHRRAGLRPPRIEHVGAIAMWIAAAGANRSSAMMPTGSGSAKPRAGLRD